MSEGPRTGRRIFAYTFLATLLVQIAWVGVVPLLRGVDEFDHAYKADAVAHGQWTHAGTATHGRGQLVQVTSDLASVARHPCESRAYTGRDNCRPVATTDDGLAVVASAAATYDPVYYAVVGSVGRPFGGELGVWVMRLTTAVICSLFLAWAVSISASSRSVWPVICWAVASTPVLLYSGSIVSPNGVGYAAAATLWAALLATAADSRVRSAPLMVAGATLVITHTTGALWLACISLVASVLLGFPTLTRTWRAHRARVASVLGVWAAAVAFAATWIVVNNTNALSPPDSRMPPLRVADLARGELLWVFQAVGAFPMRDQPAPLGVYALWFTVLIPLVVLAARATSRRTWAALALLSVMWVGIPAALTVASYDSEGLAWQGRYALPLALGVPAIAGHVLAARGREPRALVVGLILTGCGLAHLMSCLGVAITERDYAGPRLFTVSPVGVLAVVVLVAVATLLWWQLLVRARAREATDRQDRKLTDSLVAR